MKKIHIVILLGVLLIFSCKKDKLEGEKEVFIGTWNWEYSHHDYGWCENQQYEEILTPASENKTFSIKFEKQAEVFFYQDGNLIKSYRIIFTGFNSETIQCASMIDAYHFGMDFKDDGESDFYGCINTDTLRVEHFEDFIFSSELGCEDYNNYFVKE